MSDRIAIFWPGDYRSLPNETALSQLEAATQNLEKALDRLGQKHYRIKGFITRPHEAIEKLSNIDDKMIGMYTHWVYGPHTTEGVVGKGNPLLLVSNFSGKWPGLVGLLNTGACLAAEERAHSRIWSDAQTWDDDEVFLQQLQKWCDSGTISHPDHAIKLPPQPSSKAKSIAQKVASNMASRRPLALMLGDTSMGMTNGYFGARKLHKLGFSEHKIDQAWILDYGKRISDKRIEDAFKFVNDRGVCFHYGEEGAKDFHADATREQLRDYLCVLDMVDEFKADCVGWQYQLGLINQRPPSDFAEGLLNSICRPEGNGAVIIDATEADQGNLLPMEMMKRLLDAKGLHHSVAFHDIRWGLEVEGRFIWVLLNSGSAGAYAYSMNEQTLEGVHSFRQPSQFFPVPGGTFSGRSLPGQITWARAWLDGDEPVMDIGHGEVVDVAPDVLKKMWQGTTPQWPIMSADLGLSRDSLMAHYMSNHIAVAYGDIFDEMAELSRLQGYRVRYLNDDEVTCPR